MFNFLKNLYARFALGTLLRNYDSDPVPEQLVRYLVAEDWAMFSWDDYELTVTLKNKVVVCLWNENRFYAWLKKGHASINGEVYAWSNAMPTPYTTLLFKRKLEHEFEKLIKEA